MLAEKLADFEEIVWHYPHHEKSCFIQVFDNKLTFREILRWGIENVMNGHALVVIEHLIRDPRHGVLALIDLLNMIIVLSTPKMAIISLLIVTFVKP